MIKGSTQKEDITVVNIYVLNIGAPQFITQILTAIKGKIESNTIIMGKFNTAPPFINGQIIQIENQIGNTALK